MRTGQGFILTFSITSRQSFNEATVFRDQIHRVKDADHVPIVLTGNKCDLEDERQVTTQEATALSKSWNVPFYEASALARINVEESFFDLVREIRKSVRPGSSDLKGSKAKSGAKNKQGCNLF
jgi:GTPase KRas protein